MGLHPEKRPEEYQVGFDPQESFAKVDEDRGVEDTVVVVVEVLDAVVLQKPLKKSLSSGFFSMGYGSPAAARHMLTSFSRRNLLFSSTSKSLFFAFDYFHS
jgi:hypothetical protein